MLRYICEFLIYCMGWTINFETKENQGVIIGYPHTSYFDSLLIILLSFIKSGYCIINGDTAIYRNLSRFLGHIYVNRFKNLSQVNQICEQYKKKQKGYIFIAPEGALDYKPNIRTGFYYIAKQLTLFPHIN